MAYLSRNKKLTLGVIFLMLLVLLFQLINILSDKNESKDDEFEFTGAYFTLKTQHPDSLKQFYIRNFNFYPLNLNGNFIENGAVRFKFVKSNKPVPQTIVLRVDHLSRLFRKLIKNKIDFAETKHLDENDFLTFTIFDPDSNKIIVIEE